MQVKTTMKYHFTPVRMAIIKKKTPSVGKDVEERESLCTIGRIVIGTVTMENMEVPQKIKNRTTMGRGKSLQSCPTFCDSMDCSPPGSSVHGILQAGIREWVAPPSSRGAS